MLEGRLAYICEDCGARIPRDTPAPARFATHAPIEARVLAHFPFPIAYGLHHTIAAPNATQARTNLCFTYEAALRYACLILLADFLQGSQECEKAARQVRQVYGGTAGNWYTALRALATEVHVEPFRSRPEGGPFSPELVTAVRKLDATRVGKMSLHERLISFRNKHSAHGGVATEEVTEPELREMLPHLLQALELLSVLGDLQPWRAAPGGGFVCTIGFTRSFPPGDPPAGVREALDTADIAISGPGGVIPLYPLLRSRAGTVDGLTDPLLTLYQPGDRELVYTGVGVQTKEKAGLAEWNALLEGKRIDPRSSRSDLAPWTIAEWARVRTDETLGLVRAIKYFPDAYVERKGVDDRVLRWLNTAGSAALLLAADAGRGKTSLLCRLAESRHATHPQDAVLLLLGESFRRGGGDLFDAVRSGLGLAGNDGGVRDFAELLALWEKKARDDRAPRSILLLVDAVNESEDPRALLDRISDLAISAAAAHTRAGRVYVRLLVSMRARHMDALAARWERDHDTPFLRGAEHFAHFEGETGKSAPYLSLRAFNAAESEQAWRGWTATMPNPCRAPWDTLDGPVQRMLAEPLLCRVFHEVYAGIEAPPKGLAADAVWAQWLTSALPPGGLLERTAIDLAAACVEAGELEPPMASLSRVREAWLLSLGGSPMALAGALDPIERLESAGVLRGSPGGGVAWVSDTVAELTFFAALKRMGSGDFAVWMKHPATARLDRALTRAAVEAFVAGEVEALRVLLGEDRGAVILGDALEREAPIGAPGEIGERLEVYGGRVGALRRGHWATPADFETFWRVLQWEVIASIEDRLGAAGAVSVLGGEAQKVAERLAALEPDNTNFLRDLSISHDRLADLDTTSDPKRARDGFDKSLRIAERLAALEPDNIDFLRDLSISYERLAHLDRNSDPKRARDGFEKVLRIAERLAALEPGNTTFLRDLSVSYNNLADLDKTSDPKRARDGFEKGLRIRERLAALQPDNTSFLRDLSVSYERLADLDTTSDPKRARDGFEKGLRIAERLAALEPDNTSFLRDFSISYERLADLDTTSDPKRARDGFEKGLRIAERLAALEPDNTIFLLDLSTSYDSLADLDKTSDPGRARAGFEKGLRIRERLAALEPDNTIVLRDLVFSYYKLENYRRALEIAEDLLNRQPENPDHQNLVRILRESGATSPPSPEASDDPEPSKRAMILGVLAFVALLALSLAFTAFILQRTVVLVELLWTYL